MSESGSSNLPSGPKLGLNNLPPSKAERRARVERASGELAHVRKPLRIPGEVVGKQENGTLRIKTAKGEIELKIAAQNAKLPAIGEEVEIELPAGKPPRQANIHPAPPKTETTKPTTTPQDNQNKTPSPTTAIAERDRVERPQTSGTERQTTAADGDEAAPRALQTPRIATQSPLPREIIEQVATKTAAPPPDKSATLRPDDVVRLTPLHPFLQSSITREPQTVIETQAATITERAAFIATLTVEAAQSEQLEQVVAVPKESATVIEKEVLPRLPVTVTYNTVPSYNALPVETIEQLPLPQTVAPQATAAPIVSQQATVFTSTSIEFAVFQELPVLPLVFTAPVLTDTPDQPVQTSTPTQQTTPTAVQLSPQVLQRPVLSLQTPTQPQIQTGVSEALPQTIPTPLLTVPAPPVAIVPHSVTVAENTPPPLIQNLIVTPQPEPQSFNPLAPPPAAPKPFIDIPAPLAQKVVTENLDISITTVTPPPIKLIAPQSVTAPSPLDQKQPVTNLMTVVPPKPAEAMVQHSHAGQFSGEVIGIAPGNLPVISLTSPLYEFPQLYTVQFNAANTPPGTRIDFVPQTNAPSATPETFAYPSTTATTVGGLFTSFQWPALNELTQTLQQVMPQAMQQLANTTPNPAQPARLPAAALLFIAAVRSGDISGWLGDKQIDTLRRAGKGNILERITRDFGSLQRTSSEPVSQDWRALNLPLYWNGDLHKAMLYFRHDGGEHGQGEEDKKGKRTRFIFDLSLNRMGPVQLDGLHDKGRLDLVVRTKSQLSQEMQKHMRRTYITALESADIVGELSFQNKPEQWIKIDPPRDEIGVSV